MLVTLQNKLWNQYRQPLYALTLNGFLHYPTFVLSLAVAMMKFIFEKYLSDMFEKWLLNGDATNLLALYVFINSQIRANSDTQRYR